MSRLLAYVGPEIRLDQLILTPSHGLLNQALSSQRQYADGLRESPGMMLRVFRPCIAIDCLSGPTPICRVWHAACTVICG